MQMTVWTILVYAILASDFTIKNTLNDYFTLV